MTQLLAFYALRWSILNSSAQVPLNSFSVDTINCILDNPIYVAPYGQDLILSDGKHIYLSTSDPLNERCVYLSKALQLLESSIPKSLLSNKKIVARNYLEPGNIFLLDDLKISDFSYAVIGDTHHVRNSFSYSHHICDKFRFDLITSLANPNHLCAFKPYSDIIIEYPVFGFGGLELAYESLRLLDFHSFSSNFLFSCCCSLPKWQIGRISYIRELISDSNLLENTYLFEHSHDQSLYIKNLRNAHMSIVPSLNGQLSPQITSSLLSGRLPVVDSPNIFGSSPSHQLTKGISVYRFASDYISESKNLICNICDYTDRSVCWLNDCIDHLLSFPNEHDYFFNQFLNHNAVSITFNYKDLQSDQALLMACLDSIFACDIASISSKCEKLLKTTYYKNILLRCISQLKGTSNNNFYNHIIDNIIL